MSERTSCLQKAEREIARGLLEGPEHAFFAGMGRQIVCADQGDVTAAVEQALAELGVCLVVKAKGGPVCAPGDIEEWDASIRIGEIVATHRIGNWDGKAADVVADAVLSAFAHGGAFRPKHLSSDEDKDGNPIIEITGTCWVLMPGCPDGTPPELPEDEGPGEEDLEALG